MAGSKATALILLAGLALGLLALTQKCSAQPPIEELQRKFQARYYALQSDFVEWPPCGCSPAPHFPKNGYYGDLSQNPGKMLELIGDLAGKFLTNAVIYDQFVRSPNNSVDDIEGVSSIPMFNSWLLPADLFNPNLMGGFAPNVSNLYRQT